MSLALSVLASLALTTDAADTTVPPQNQTAQERLAALERENREILRRLDLLAEELERAHHGDTFTPVGDGTRGLAPAASKIYRSTSPLSIGGYGEMLYNNFQGGTTPDRLDFLRAVLYFGYKFNDRWLLNTEFEFEHASVEDTATGSSRGSVSVEFAYLEYLATDWLSFRVGLLLLPMGWVNELHEPTTFWSANRPVTENRIIPTTWRENGFGVVGETGPFEWRAYVVNGMNAAGFRPNGLRGGRQKGAEALAEDFAVVGRLDYVGVDDLIVGVSGYRGDSDQDLAGVGSVCTLILDAHAEYSWRGLRLRGLYAWAQLDEVEELNAAIPAITGTNSIGEELRGWYVEAGYDVLNHTGSRQQLIPFVRYERVDTNFQVPDGFVQNPALDEEFVTFGVAWKPHEQIIFKADYVDADNKANAGQDIFRLAVGYVF
jgi:hypothetical protein